ncbi:hypothetical protein ACHAW5_008695 [Stephanodiscus triporus]|uniref:Uncharacterized protein n=1 Tax=Stephanodiscus triporus TaxID=2934178 RepID=A0ABD3NLE4_9STRA
MRQQAYDHHVARAIPGATAVAGTGYRGKFYDDNSVKSDERAKISGVGAFAVDQAAPGGRRQPGRNRRSASARMRARQRAGLEAGDIEGDGGVGGGGGGGGGMQVQEINPEDLLAADVEIDQMIITEDDEEETLGFWHLDKTDKIICGGICFLVVALVAVLAVAMT